MDSLLNSVSPIKLYKGLNFIMSIISLGIGLFSYFKSAWINYTRVSTRWTNYGYMYPYKICQIGLIEPMNFLKSCPDIAWERYFVSVIIICSILSLLSFVLEYSRSVDLRKKPCQIADVVYHILAAVALVIAGALYILSALLIYDVLDLENSPNEREYRTVEKLVASVFVFLQATCYVTTAYKLRK